MSTPEMKPVFRRTPGKSVTAYQSVKILLAVNRLVMAGLTPDAAIERAGVSPDLFAEILTFSGARLRLDTPIEDQGSELSRIWTALRVKDGKSGADRDYSSHFGAAQRDVQTWFAEQGPLDAKPASTEITAPAPLPVVTATPATQVLAAPPKDDRRLYGRMTNIERELRSEIGTLRQEIETLKGALRSICDEVSRQIVARDQQISELRARVETSSLGRISHSL